MSLIQNVLFSNNITSFLSAHIFPSDFFLLHLPVQMHARNYYLLLHTQTQTHIKSGQNNKRMKATFIIYLLSSKQNKKLKQQLKWGEKNQQQQNNNVHAKLYEFETKLF